MFRWRRLARSEKRMLTLAIVLSGIIGGSGGIYAWNNRVPSVSIPRSPLPARNAFDLYGQAWEAYRPPANTNFVDRQFDYRGSDIPDATRDLYSPTYNKFYPPGPKLNVLLNNAATLRLWRAAAQLEYREVPAAPGKSVEYSNYRRLLPLLFLQAHVTAQVGDWDGAAAQLLEIMRFGYRIPQGGPANAAYMGFHIHEKTRRELHLLLPHLSAPAARHAAQRLWAMHQGRVLPAATLQEEKWMMQRSILHLLQGGDLRGLYVIYSVLVDPKSISDKENRDAMNNLPRLLQLRLAWMNKAAIFNRYTRNMDAQMALAAKYQPVPLVGWKWPEDQDGVRLLENPDHTYLTPNHNIAAAGNLLIMTRLALHAYHLDHGRYPESLQALVPGYLPQVPQDPWARQSPLQYRRKPVRYVACYYLQVLPWQPRLPAPSPAPPKSSAPPPGSLGTAGPPLVPVATTNSAPVYRWIPYTLYSVGPDCKDNGARIYDSDKSYKSYRHALDLDQKNADIVAGVTF